MKKYLTKATPTYIKYMIKKFTRNFLPFIKYCIVGVVGTAVDLASLYVFVEYFNMSILPATTLSFLLAVANNFLLNKGWTFKVKSKNYRKLFIKFLIVSTIGLGLTLASMQIMVIHLGIWYMLAKAITSLIVLTWNFLGNKLWTFKIQNRKTEYKATFPLKLSIVIPAYNEENRIKNTLLTVVDYVQHNKINAEILVVSDGSKDGTDETIKSFGERHPLVQLITYEKNQGKGYAVKLGIMQSKGEYILFADADNSTPIEEYSNLLEAMEKQNAAIAIGSRYIRGSKVKIKQPFYRRFIGRAGNLLIRWFLIDGIKDTQCGFKLFKHRAAKEIFSLQKVSRFGFDMEAMVVAKTLEYKIVEVPVSWFNSTESRVRPIKDALITLKDLVYIKLNLWSGRYYCED